MNILLMCMAGASTSLVMNKMKAALTEDQKDWKIEAHPFDRMDEVVENFDVILIGPQIAYKKKELLRKAAESGGVHPVYIDQLSGALAVKIERVADTVEANRLGLEMLRRYCRLVRNDAHSGCSQAVQKTLSYISLHLSGELSLRSIAAALGFNATYLSAQFSRERGETLTAYIHTLRLQTARRLLDETDLPVAEVAARVGMVDVAYFSRLFKKKYGLSPLRYRARPAEG